MYLVNGVLQDEISNDMAADLDVIVEQADGVFADLDPNDRDEEEATPSALRPDAPSRNDPAFWKKP
ncbi:hypothetical protein HII36_01975 [Nonomuraea sp. NN258]|uniref:hypothetical protein n=1 Tax=Nonomuraea antri TaxID=2730852 RepID=UPI001567FFC1|nr:hypothetical protein [Nonomuraea antri]NRQ30613.1 hypothetical protein [Nonomuraea antri]